MVEIRKILFPIDFTENSSKVLPYVLSMAEKYKALIYLLHVVEEDLHLLSLRPYIPVYGDKKDLQDAEKAMEGFCEKNMQGCPNFHKKILFGDPALTILKTIESESIDMVIMGSHGHKGLKDIIFGSVAENVMKKSPVPVLVVNPYKVK